MVKVIIAGEGPSFLLCKIDPFPKAVGNYGGQALKIADRTHKFRMRITGNRKHQWQQLDRKAGC
jgi:hypothetical protein